MAKLQIKRDIFNKALESSQLDEDQRANLDAMVEDKSAKAGITSAVQRFPLPFLHSLLDDNRLTANQRAIVALQVFGMSKADVHNDKIYNISVSSPVEFGSTFSLLGGRGANCEVFLNGRWYPVTMGINFIQGQKNEVRSVALHTQIRMCEASFGMHHVVYTDLFLDDVGNQRERTIADLLRHFGLRPVQTKSVDYNLKLVKSERVSRKNGTQVVVKGPVLTDMHSFWFSSFVSRALGSVESPRKAIIDAEMEIKEEQRSYYSHYGDEMAQSKLPFVRVFSLDLKNYVYVDVDDLEEYEFDENAMSRLHLPDEMLSVLGRVFSTPVDQLFGDLISGKHGGIVVLAAGKPGVGKTLTAEVYAEHTRRPLYVLELGELGTNAEQVETNLQKVFTRVSRWNAVLQFDECEIFLSKRGNDLERSAIVGIFLRLLDYYQGILFLTTNRCDVLDHAVLSRVMLKLDYPDLDVNARAIIWKSMFDAAQLTLVEDRFAELAKRNINGRQIRNLTRLAKILYPGGTLSLEEMNNVLVYGTTVDADKTVVEVSFDSKNGVATTTV